MYRGESQLVMEKQQKHGRFHKTLDTDDVGTIATCPDDDSEMLSMTVLRMSILRQKWRLLPFWGV